LSHRRFAGRQNVTCMDDNGDDVGRYFIQFHSVSNTSNNNSVGWLLIIYLVIVYHSTVLRIVIVFNRMMF
jgi:hypothetical protein